MKNQKAFASLLNAVEKAKTGGQSKENINESTYYPERDKAGNAYAVIRFLPGKTDEDAPFVKHYNHGFKSAAGKWFIENCPTTISGTCPVCEANSTLWNSGVDSDKEIVRARKRKLSYFSNVLVVSDSKNPENEGKVFLFKYGQKVFDKIIDKIQPQFEDESPMNPFDALEGANFKFKIRQVEKFANYDKSEFEDPSAIGSQKEIAALLDQITDLSSIVAPEKFKSYDALKSKFDAITNTPDSASAKQPSDKEHVAENKVVDDEDEDSLKYFQDLANADD